MFLPLGSVNSGIFDNVLVQCHIKIAALNDLNYMHLILIEYGWDLNPIRI